MLKKLPLFNRLQNSPIYRGPSQLPPRFNLLQIYSTRDFHFAAWFWKFSIPDHGYWFYIL